MCIVLKSVDELLNYVNNAGLLFRLSKTKTCPEKIYRVKKEFQGGTNDHLKMVVE